MTASRTSICVTYKNADGWHVFASDELPGLYVASKDARTAYEDVATAIEKLLELNRGIKVKVEPELSFGEFLRSFTKSQAKEKPAQRPLVMTSQRYAVYAT